MYTKNATTEQLCVKISTDPLCLFDFSAVVVVLVVSAF